MIGSPGDYSWFVMSCAGPEQGASSGNMRIRTGLAEGRFGIRSENVHAMGAIRLCIAHDDKDMSRGGVTADEDGMISMALRLTVDRARSEGRRVARQLV